jgi:hypothetical protein
MEGEPMTKRFEAIINGNEMESLDPVVRIIIDNGFHRYEFAPADVQRIDIRELPPLDAETEAAHSSESEGEKPL